MLSRSVNPQLLCALLVLSASISLRAQLARDLTDSPVNPLRRDKVTVLLFVRIDCPISNRYAPEFQRLASEFPNVKFWLVYPDQKETAKSILKHVAEYGYKLSPLRDPHHELVHRSHAQITPEAAVFYGSDLRYIGRIDDHVIDFGAFRPNASRHDLEQAIHAVINGQPIQKPSGPAVGCYISDLE